MASLETVEFKEDNTTQVFSSSEQGTRQCKSAKYAREAALSAAIGRVEAKMPGPITRAISRQFVKLKYGQ